MENDLLSAREVRNLREPGYHLDGRGLYLQVTPAAKGEVNKSWVFRYRINKKRRDMGLGSFLDVSLKEARNKRDELRKLLADKIDPLAHKKKTEGQLALQNAKSMTFSECAEAYIELNRPKWKNAKHAKQWASTIEAYCNPFIGKTPVQDVDVGLVLKVLEPIWEKTETATRVRQRIETILDYAKSRKYRTGENPAAWKGNLENILPHIPKTGRVKPHTALPYGDMAAFMKSLRSREALAARALEFTILTAARTGEVTGARATEFDFDNAIWTVPGERMKGKRDHRVPLSPRAVEIAKAQAQRGGEYLFPLSNNAMLNLLHRRMKVDVTAHGFRSSFRDWAAEQTNYPHEVCEMALAHTISNKAEAAYRRGDLLEKRRPLMVEWATYCDTERRPGN